MLISVLICTYDRGNLINDTLDALINKQTREPDEIVVVNGGGTNNCQEILRKWNLRFPKLIVIETENLNLARSRNVGLQYCSGDLILQTDDDARPLSDWIEKIIFFHRKYPEYGVIGGAVFDKNIKTLLSLISDVITFPNYSNPREVRNVPGVNSSYKKRVIKEIGKYDETLFRGEDVDYNWRAIQKGWKVLFHPEVKVHHIHRSTWKGLFYQHYMYGRAHYLVRSKWENMYSPYPKKITSFYFLLKWAASWTWIPIFDAHRKAKKISMFPNGFDILIIFLINLTNRFGSYYQRNIVKK